MATLTADGLPVQHLNPPAVYLDHWAFNEIARDEGLSRRFAAGLERREGTLALSWANVAEFGNVLDGEQGRQAERFIDANLPRVFCIEVEPFKVIERERKGVPSPESDDEFLRVFVRLKADPPKEITASGLLTVVQGHLKESHERLAAIFMERHERLSADYGSDENFVRLVRQMPKKSAATITVLREILAAFLKDRTWKADPHDVMDFFHAIVPSVYCQWVLLDKDWAAHVERAQRTLRDAGVDQLMGTILTKRAGVDTLIAWLEEA